jgi:hypothetical protein
MDDTLTQMLFRGHRLCDASAKLGQCREQLRLIGEELGRRNVPDRWRIWWGCNPAWADEPIPDGASPEESLARQRAHEAVNADDIGMLCTGALLLHRAYFAMWEEKLCGIYLALLPFVCQAEVMTCHSMPPKSRVICCAYQFAYTLVYRLQLEAKPLPGKPQLPSQRRSSVSNDVLLLGKAAIKQSTSSQRLVRKCGLNNWKRISSGLDMQRIGKATELRRKRRLPSSDEEDE